MDYRLADGRTVREASRRIEATLRAEGLADPLGQKGSRAQVIEELGDIEVGLYLRRCTRMRALIEQERPSLGPHADARAATAARQEEAATEIWKSRRRWRNEEVLSRRVDQVQGSNAYQEARRSVEAQLAAEGLHNASANVSREAMSDADLAMAYEYWRRYRDRMTARRGGYRHAVPMVGFGLAKTIGSLRSEIDRRARERE